VMANERENKVLPEWGTLFSKRPFIRHH